MNTSLKTRFPPSPTGMLHVGSLRTALFNYLYAKKHGGTFMLRIEDTDQERFVEGGIENIIRTLEWAGLTPDEGPFLDEAGVIHQKGDAGPYIQSERLPIYKQHVDQLIAAGHAYYAFDTSEALEEMRERQRLNKLPTKYERENMVNQYTLGEEETQKKIQSGEDYVVRLKIPTTGETSFHDLIRGTICFQNSEIDDQVLLKSDGFPTYHLAVVVDDHLMGVTHISRGEEWLSSTPKHILLYQMFGWEAPIFAHQTLLVNEQKQKLSKRHGDVSVEDFVEKGYLKEALINFVAFLGWNPGGEKEIFSLEELIAAFDMNDMAKSPAVFNREKLNWYNKQYLMSLPLEEVAKRALPFFRHAGIIRTEEIDDTQEYEQFKAAIDLERSRVNTLAELAQALGFIYSDSLSYDPSLLIWKKDTQQGSKAILGQLATCLESIALWNKESLETTLKEWIATNNFGVGNVLWPMRVALSGQKDSPGPFDIAAVLGKEKTVARIRAAEALL